MSRIPERNHLAEIRIAKIFVPNGASEGNHIGDARVFIQTLQTMMWSRFAFLENIQASNHLFQCLSNEGGFAAVRIHFDNMSEIVFVTAEGHSERRRASQSRERFGPIRQRPEQSRSQTQTLSLRARPEAGCGKEKWSDDTP